MRWLGGSSEFIYRWHERYSIAVQSVAKKANVTLLDVRSAFLERRDYTRFLCDDGIHPNAQGHALIADVMKGVLVPIWSYEVNLRMEQESKNERAVDS